MQFKRRDHCTGVLGRVQTNTLKPSKPCLLPVTLLWKHFSSLSFSYKMIKTETQNCRIRVSAANQTGFS